jgi:Cytochrome P450
MTFFLAVALYPDVIQKAHEELDKVVGRDRLPQISDKPSLPYIHALVKEVFRWHPPTPLCQSFQRSGEVELPLIVFDCSACPYARGGWCLWRNVPSRRFYFYGKYMVPRNQFVLASDTVTYFQWRGILHDPDVFKDPETFNPERFLKDGQLDPDIRPPESAVFGFGRRYVLQLKEYNVKLICKSFVKEMPWPAFGARDNIFEHCLYISDVRHWEGHRRTWESNHSKRRVYNGVDRVSLLFALHIVYDLMKVFIYYSCPLPFKVSIKPRSQHASSVIDDAYAVYHSRSWLFP